VSTFSIRLGTASAATAAALASIALLIPAPAPALTIRANQSHVTQLGHFHTSSDLGHAIHAFGQPSSRHHDRFSGCLVRWKKLKLRIDFENFGSGDACSKKGGQAQSFSIGFEKRWRTSRHLRVGQSVKRLKHRYRHARRHGSEYWLKSAYSPIGDGGHYAVLAARTHHLRWVSGFSGWIGSAGE
jgi:hypothetical protein